MNFKIERSEKISSTNKMITEFLTEFKYLRDLFIIFKQIIFLGKILDEDEGGIGELGLFLMIIIFLQIRIILIQYLMILLLIPGHLVLKYNFIFFFHCYYFIS